jgi:nucleotide-binding universal stress UspA family protein
VASLFKHILVPLDFTEKNVVALRVALDLAKQSEAGVTLMHVIETIEYAEDEEIAAFYESLKERARAKLDSCAEQFRLADVPVTQQIVMGKTAGGIVDYAAQEGVDLVVLSSHKINLEDAPRGWATLSHQVSILCQCPVMLVK